MHWPCGPAERGTSVHIPAASLARMRLLNRKITAALGFHPQLELDQGKNGDCSLGRSRQTPDCNGQEQEDSKRIKNKIETHRG